MIRGVAMLQDAGADCIAILCNTAHLWFEQLQAATRARLLHIVEAVVMDLQRQGIHEGAIGILGTRATLETDLYQRFLTASGYKPMVPTCADALADCAMSITAVKGNRLEEAFAPVARAVESLAVAGVRAIVLGCTELTLALPEERRGGVPARAHRLDRCSSPRGRAPVPPVTATRVMTRRQRCATFA